MLHIIDHTEPHWDATYQSYKRENGAATYSRDIVKYHIPVYTEWAEAKNKSVLISTVPPFTSIKNLPEYSDIAFQYLHTYKYLDPTKLSRSIAHKMQNRTGRLIFVTAYKQMQQELEYEGLEAMFIPMAVDVQRIQDAVIDVKKHNQKKVIYFGNLTPPKQPLHRELERAFLQNGLRMDTISSGKFNERGFKLTQEQAWRKIAEYEYGIGVGRCAQEMQAIGLKVMIAGGHFGGLTTNEMEWMLQLGVNNCGRICTFNQDIQSCIRMMDLSIIKSWDISESVELLRNELKSY